MTANRLAVMVVAVVALGCFAATANATVDFAPPLTVPSEPGVNDIAILDQNGDGVPDLASSSGAGAAVLLRGLGAGRFATPTTVATDDTSIGVLNADFDRDGAMDLATANLGGRSITVLLNDGGGGVRASVRTALERRPLMFAAGDLNGDGLPDLVVSFGSGTSVGVLTGRGDGSFATATVQVGARTTGVAVADLSGDGIPDLAVATWLASPGIRVLHGTGTGGFAVAQAMRFGRSPFVPVAADLDGDGRVDLAVTDRDANLVHVLTGVGGGVFRSPRRLLTSTSPVGIAAGDVTGDRLTDLVVANQFSGDVTAFEAIGAGRFVAGRQFAAGLFPQFVRIGDVTGDGRVDVVTTSLLGAVAVLRSRAPGGRDTAKTRTPCRDTSVTPGLSIACARLGMSRAELRELFGPPLGAVRRSGGVELRYPWTRVLMSANAAVSITTREPGLGVQDAVVGADAVMLRGLDPEPRCRPARGDRVCRLVDELTNLETRFVVRRHRIAAISLAAPAG